MTRVRGRVGGTLIGLLALGVFPSGQATSGEISVKAVAEVRVATKEGGIEAVHLSPAGRVVPGDELMYTLEIRNAGASALHSPTVTYPVPAHMALVADSVTGPGADVTYSVDGGLSFGAPEELKTRGEDGNSRQAFSSEYTHIRWKFKNTLKSNSVAFTRFRVVVK